MRWKRHCGWQGTVFSMDLADLSALMGEALPAESNSGIWVVLPGEFGADLARSGGAALISEARNMAVGMGCRVHAIAEHAEAAQGAIAYGADCVMVAGDAMSALVSQQPEF